MQISGGKDRIYMERNIEKILGEILEHTIDCDADRAQHFNENIRYSKWNKILNILQIICLICIVAYYMVESEIKSWGIAGMNLWPIAWSALATTIQIVTYFSGCEKLARQHWIAAQAYSRLYRDCQFFCTHHAEISEEVLRQKAQDISVELCNLNLMSPELNDKSYSKVVDKLASKKYPIEKVIEEKKLNRIENVIDTIKNKYREYVFEIIAFGSYLSSIYYDDIDLAVIIYKEDVDKELLQEISIEIQDQYIVAGLNLDITIITEKELSISSYVPFIRNVKNGKRLYIVPMVKQSVFDKTFEEIDYDTIIKCYYEDLVAAHDGNDTKIYVNKAYYYLYHVISYLLNMRGIAWYSEISISKKFYEIAKDSTEEMQLVHRWFELLRKEKNSEFVSEQNVFVNKDDLNLAIIKINNWINENYIKKSKR